MKFIGSWKDKTFGIQINNWYYLVHILHRDVRFFGYKREIYDGLPIDDIGLWYIGFQRIYIY